MARSTTAKNGHERITTNRDNIRHLEYFMNGQWRHSYKCKEFTNKECVIKIIRQHFTINNRDKTRSNMRVESMYAYWMSCRFFKTLDSIKGYLRGPNHQVILITRLN